MESGAVKGFITRAFSHTGTRRGKNFSISSDAYQIARMMLQKQDSKLLCKHLPRHDRKQPPQSSTRAPSILPQPPSDSVIFSHTKEQSLGTPRHWWGKDPAARWRRFAPHPGDGRQHRTRLPPAKRAQRPCIMHLYHTDTTGSLSRTCATSSSTSLF